MAHPYKGQLERSRWSRAVTPAAATGLKDVYRKKFDLSPGDRIAAAGSCFAQHIGRRLAQSGYAYQDFEPPPAFLPPADHAKFGYGLFSARYGNVYTARQMLQLIQRARGAFLPEEDCWEQEGRFYDPFRPGIEPGGFATREEMEAVRTSHFRAVLRMVRTTDVFVFTLGLTEAWEAADGAVFQVCPGTVAGEFDPARHQFRNFTHEEIAKDLRAVIRWLRAGGRRVRVILTVSPVPLAATATGNHVLVATSYSKAVLRAVAGEVADGDPDVDYFPSYEIVTSQAARGAFWEPDLRNVADYGVDHVMSHFFNQHPVVERPRDKKAASVHPDDLVCEEGLYDA